MNTILSYITQYPALTLTGFVLSNLLWCIAYQKQRNAHVKQQQHRDQHTADKQLKRFELLAENYQNYISLLNQFKANHQVAMAKKIESLIAQFTEDMHAAVELNNSKKERALSDQFKRNIQTLRHTLSQDVLNIKAVSDQLRLFAPDNVRALVNTLNASCDDINAALGQSLDQINDVANDPFANHTQFEHQQALAKTEQLSKHIDDFITLLREEFNRI